MSSRVSLKVSYGVLLAALDNGTGWEVWSRVSASVCRRRCRWWCMGCRWCRLITNAAGGVAEGVGWNLAGGAWSRNWLGDVGEGMAWGAGGLAWSRTWLEGVGSNWVTNFLFLYQLQCFDCWNAFMPFGVYARAIHTLWQPSLLPRLEANADPLQQNRFGCSVAHWLSQAWDVRCHGRCAESRNSSGVCRIRMSH